MIDDFPEFNVYLRHVKEGKNNVDDRTMGGFQLVMQSQRNDCALQGKFHGG